MKVFGLAGWSGSGKTHLMVRLLSELTGRGCKVSTVKHAHHGMDVDKPGKDSYRHREAGATEVMVVSDERWALMHELRDEQEPDLDEMLSHMSDVDLVLVEGFKHYPHPKIEVWRADLGKELLARTETNVVAIASHDGDPGAGLPVIDVNDIGAVADFIIGHCALKAG